MIANKYKVVSKIGEGKFGKVYKGIYQKTGEDVAIKFECIVMDTVLENGAPLKLLKQETTILHYLQRNHCQNVPLVYWYGVFMEKPTLVMPFYPGSLQDYVENIYHEGGKLSTETVAKIMTSMIEILDSIHTAFVIHRDIKPDNFMVTLKEDGTVKLTLIDFGMATVFVDEYKKHCVQRSENHCQIMGTPKFISIHVHDGIQPSRRDDIISVGYIGLWMLHGSLHWANIDCLDEDPDTNPSSSSSYEMTHILHPMNRAYKIAKQSFLHHCTFQTPTKSAEMKLGDYKDPREWIDTIESCIMYYIKKVYDLDYSEKPNYHSFCEMFAGIKEVQENRK